MKTASPFLAVPIRALVAAGGALLEADPPIWRLHGLAGGDATGKLAVPALADLVAMTARTKMPAQRALRIADEEQDVELWVETRNVGKDVELRITGWRDLPWSRRDDPRELEVGGGAKGDDAIVIDRHRRIIRLPAFVPGKVTGQIADALIIPVSEAGLADLLVRQEALTGVAVTLAGMAGTYVIDLLPQHDGGDEFVGHIGTLRRVENEPPVADTSQSPMPMGRQFASVLKQPLSRIVANAETIGSRLRGPLRDNYAEYAQDIANAARHLTELVSDMEDLEAIDRPDFAVARDRIELGDIARRVGGLLALKASDHGMAITLPDESQKAEANGEFRRVLQIMLNLVGNAIRYAPDGSTVTIRIEKSAEGAMISVADQGSGVPAEDRTRIFDKFERLGRSGDGGSGLGLYISQRLARAMDGELTIGDAPGDGALFTLTLPAR